MGAVAAVAIPLVASYIANQMNKSGDSKVDDANANKLQLMGQAQKDLSAYRPQMANAQMGAMGQQLGQFKGAQDALATMYGGGAHASAMPGRGLPNPGMLAGSAAFGRLPGAPQAPVGPDASGLRPMPSLSLPGGNGPPLGTPQRGLPDPAAFLLGMNGRPRGA